MKPCRHEIPDHTEGYEGFFHITNMEGTVKKSMLSYIVRDHDRDRFERWKKKVQQLVNEINA